MEAKLSNDDDRRLQKNENALFPPASSQRLSFNYDRPLLIFNHNPKAGGGSIVEVVREAKGGNRETPPCELRADAFGPRETWYGVAKPSEILQIKEENNITEQNWTDQCFVYVKEMRASNIATRRLGFVIGSVREPCSHYLSLWSYNSNGDGARKNFGKEFHGTSKPYFNTTTDIHNFRQWVQHPDVFGQIREQFHGSYNDFEGFEGIDGFEGMDDVDGADCFVFVEVLQYSLVRCLRLYEQQGGLVHWDGPLLSELIPKAEEQEKDIIAKLTQKQQQQQQQQQQRQISSQRTDGQYHQIRRRLKYVKDDPINNPQQFHHDPCLKYFDNATISLLLGGPEKGMYHRFGYQGCCSKDFDYETWLSPVIPTDESKHIISDASFFVNTTATKSLSSSLPLPIHDIEDVLELTLVIIVACAVFASSFIFFCGVRWEVGLGRRKRSR